MSLSTCISQILNTEGAQLGPRDTYCRYLLLLDGSHFGGFLRFASQHKLCSQTPCPDPLAFLGNCQAVCVPLLTVRSSLCLASSHNMSDNLMEQLMALPLLWSSLSTDTNITNHGMQKGEIIYYYHLLGEACQSHNS
jgi:hypothetical protein